MQNQQLKFELDKLVMQKGIWSMHLKIYTAMTKVYRGYQIKLAYNETDLLTRIKDNEKLIIGIESTPSLMAEEDAIKVNNMRRQIEEIGVQLLEMRKVCREIHCTAYVSELKNGFSETKVVFIIPYKTVNDVNEMWAHIGEYGITMEPLLTQEQ